VEEIDSEEEEEEEEEVPAPAPVKSAKKVKVQAPASGSVKKNKLDDSEANVPNKKAKAVVNDSAKKTMKKFKKATN